MGGTHKLINILYSELVLLVDILSEIVKVNLIALNRNMNGGLIELKRLELVSGDTIEDK